MLNSPVTSSVMKSGQKVWYFWVRSCVLVSQGIQSSVWAGILVLYPSVQEYGTKYLHFLATVTETAPFQLATPLRLQ